MVRLAYPKTCKYCIPYDENDNEKVGFDELPIQHQFRAISETASNTPSQCIDELLSRAIDPDADETTHTCKTITNDIPPLLIFIMERQHQKHVAGAAAQSTSR